MSEHGDRPKGWVSVRLGDHTTVKARLGWKGLKADEYIEDGYIFLATPNLKANQIDFENVNYISKWRFEESPEIQLKLGDVLIVKDGSTLGISNFVRHLPRPTTVNGSIAVVRSDSSLFSEFFYHLVNGNDFQELITLKKAGLGVPHLFQADLRKFAVSLPPFGEQRKIARILTTLDNLIEKTESLIAKYQAIKQGMMHDFFTRGVDAHGHLRPPQTEAPDLYKQSELGWIPMEWACVCFGTLIMSGPQNGLYKPLSAYSDDGFPIVRIDGFYDGVLNESSSFRRLNLTAIELVLYGLANDDILVNRVNSIDYVGKSAIVKGLVESTVYESNIMRLKVDVKHLNPDFAIRLLCLPIVQRQWRQCAKSAIAQASINQSDIKGCVLPVPPVSEQIRLLELIDSNEGSIKSEMMVLSKLHLQKQGLMQDLLTGKVRVAVDDAGEVAHA